MNKFNQFLNTLTEEEVKKFQEATRLLFEELDGNTRVVNINDNKYEVHVEVMETVE